MKNYLLLFVFLCVAGIQQMVAQQVSSQLLKGKVLSDAEDKDNIYVFNLKTKKAVLTENGGFFTISASLNDTLQFSSVQYKSLKIALKEQDFKNDIFYVRLQVLTQMLDEVKIQEYQSKNAVSAGVLSKPAKVYTPAERKLHEATTGGGLVPLNPILNAISGRTTKLKKQVKVEQKEYLLQKLDYFLDDKYYIEVLKIPEEYIDGFKYFLVEDEQLTTALKAKNKTLMKFLITDLGRQYLQLLTEAPKNN